MKMALVDMDDIHRVAVPVYSDVEHRTWATLLANQQRVLPGRACKEFLSGLATIDFPRDHIPRLADVSDRIEAATGWRLVRVDGIVPDDAFFALLAARCFPSTDFIRKPEELGYTPAPDMFHDLLGHVPLLTDVRFCAFFERFGQVGVRAFALDHPAKVWLPRIYWYAVEFGLIREQGEYRIYGSGILSSPDEVLFSLSDQADKQPFDIDTVSAKPYDIWHMQKELFVIDSFDQLEQTFARWADRLF
jgi:phenylalanine-4-hydroxylase